MRLKDSKTKLKEAGLEAQAHQPITVFYDGEIVGEFVAGVIVENVIILELKSVRRVITVHENQLVRYLTATHKDVGLIVNFGERKVEVTRELPQNSSER